MHRFKAGTTPAAALAAAALAAAALAAAALAVVEPYQPSWSALCHYICHMSV